MLNKLTIKGRRLILPALIALCGISFSETTLAQVQIGSAETAAMNRAGKLSKEEFASLKNTTTLFVLQSKDAGREAEFEKAIAQVWKVTPFRVILPGDMDRYGSDEYSFFSFGGYVVTSRGGSGGSSMHVSYDLWRPKYNKDGDWRGRMLFARFLLSPDGKTMFDIMGKNWGWGSKKASRESTEILFTQASFDNWGPGLIKGYVKIVNDRLEEEQRQGAFSRNNNPELLKNLSHDTLFIPQYVNDKFSPFNGRRSVDEETDEADIAGAYPYPVKYVSAQELDNMLINRKTPFYYLLYIRSSADKHVNVFNGITGEAVYSAYTPMSYNFKEKDLVRLAKEIKKN